MQSAADAPPATAPPAAPEGCRPAALNQAALFLNNPSVQKSDDIEGKKRFLVKKGLTEGASKETALSC